MMAGSPDSHAGDAVMGNAQDGSRVTAKVYVTGLERLKWTASTFGSEGPVTSVCVSMASIKPLSSARRIMLCALCRRIVQAELAGVLTRRGAKPDLVGKPHIGRLDPSNNLRLSPYRYRPP